MIQKTKKKTLFLIGLLLTGVVGSMSDYIRNNYTKVGSLILDSSVNTAYADGVIDTPGSSDGGCSGGGDSF